MIYTVDDNFDDEPRRPSKSQLKRDSEALQRLGAELVALPRAQLDSLILPEQLLEAVKLAASIHQHGARKRQIKFIGGLLRAIDAEPIRLGLARLKSESTRHVRDQHRVERWRDTLMVGGEEAIDGLLAQYPGADRQHLRQLVRAARREQAGGHPPKSARLLFKYLRTLFGADG